MINNRKIQVTEDGSHTFFMNDMQVTYHSKHGAIQESKHIFIQAGLNYFIDENARSVTEAINIFEVGFGTGLNALLSLNAAINCNIKINYTTIELFPLLPEEFAQLNYAALINKELQESFIAMHECEWDKVVELDSLFSFKKIKIDLHEFQTQQQFHVIYFDAFDPIAQPGLWTKTIFKKMHDSFFTNGILTTYCSKGIVRRAMQNAGFKVEKLKGPKGKREIVRAIKI